jgi:hypothetical protein
LGSSVVGRRDVMNTVLWMGLAVTVLQTACLSEPNMSCRTTSCADFRLTASDNGKTIRMAVDEWISLEQPVNLNSTTASSSDPKVIALQSSAGYANLSYRVFHALKAGSAKLTSSSATCPAESSEPCSYEVAVEVVQFPKVKVTIDNVFETSVVHLRVGEVAQFQAPFSSSPMWKVGIDSPNIVDWVVEPIYPTFLMQAAVVAKSPGTAQVHSDPCDGPEPVCSKPWTLTFVVA